MLRRSLLAIVIPDSELIEDKGMKFLVIFSLLPELLGEHYVFLYNLLSAEPAAGRAVWATALMWFCSDCRSVAR
jgi:hypothetical protein